MRSRIGSTTKAIVTGPVAWKVLASRGIDPKTKKLYGPGGIFPDRFMDDIRAGIEAHEPESAPWMDWYKKITLQHLFDHAAGFANGGDVKGAADMFTDGDEGALSYEQLHRHFLRTRKLLFEPGTDSQYSNHGFGLWTIIVKELTGESFRSYAISHYLRPLGLHTDILPQSADPDPRDATSHELLRFRRGDEDNGGFFSEASMDGSVAAFVNTDGNLQLIPYRVSDTGALSRGELAGAGSATQIKLVLPDPSSSNVVTALRNTDGNLQLIAWSITSSGQVTRRGDASAGRVKRIALTPFPDGNGVITATRGDDDALKLIAWKLTGALNLVRGGDAEAGAVGHVAVTTTRSDFLGALSATTDSDNRLKLIAWQLDPAAARLTRRGEAEASAITGELRVVRVQLSGQDLVVTGFRDGAGDLMLIVWEVAANGQITRRGDAKAENVSLVDLAAARDGRVVASVRDSAGNLQLIAYRVAGDGKITRNGTSSAGAVDRIASSVVVRSGREFLLTAVRVCGGTLAQHAATASGGSAHADDRVVGAAGGPA